MPSPNRLPRRRHSPCVPARRSCAACATSSPASRTRIWSSCATAAPTSARGSTPSSPSARRSSRGGKAGSRLCALPRSGRDDRSHLALGHLGGVGEEAAELLGLLRIRHRLLLGVALLDLKEL